MQLFFSVFFFFSLPFPFLLISFFPTEPCINTSLHTFILHSLPPSQCSIPRLAFIFLSRSRKSKEDCIYKREHKSKNITIPVRMTAHFASLCALFFFFFFLFQLSVDSFCAIEISRRRSARRGKKEGPKVCKKKKKHSITLTEVIHKPPPLFSSISLHSPEKSNDGTASRKPAETCVIDNSADYSESVSENPRLNRLLQTCLDPVSGSSVKICQTIQSCVAAASSPSMAAAPLTAARSRVRAFQHSQVSEERGD